MEKLSAFIPMPRAHTVRYFGVLASHSKYREEIIPQNKDALVAKRKKKSYISWEDLLKRTFKLDVLNCQICGNRMKLVSVVEDRELIEDTMTALGLDPKPPNIKSAISRSLFYDESTNQRDN